MDAQDFRSLQEVYLEVYASQEELDEGREGGRFEYNQRHGRPLIDPAHSQRRSETETLGGGTYQRGPKRLPKSKRKYDRQVLSGVRAASDQEKQRARKRMGIGEDHDIDEALTGERYKKVMKKPGGTAYSRKVSEDPAKRATRGGRGGESDFGSGDRGAGNKAARRAGTYQEEGYDIYDIILSHLLDEGYAETSEAALVIMANMSEDWRESLISEYFSIGGPSVGGGGGSRGPSKRQRRKQEQERRGHELRSRAKQVVDRQRRGSHGEADSQMSAQPDRKKDYDPNSGWAHYYDDSARGRATALRPRG